MDYYYSLSLLLLADSTCMLPIWKIGCTVMQLTHPVAMTGSEYLETQRTMTVPIAMLCAARSIHHSPLPHIVESLLSSESAGTCETSC